MSAVEGENRRVLLGRTGALIAHLPSPAGMRRAPAIDQAADALALFTGGNPHIDDMAAACDAAPGGANAI
jgi:hypothetical protein